jgi:hypothetical protein
MPTMQKFLRAVALPAGLVAMSLAGCQATPTTAPARTGAAPSVETHMNGDATFFVRPTVDRYRVASALVGTGTYGVDDIHHVTLALYVVTSPGLPGETETAALDGSGVAITKDVLKADLGQVVGFTGLKRNTTYRVKATAYKATGPTTYEIISKSGASSRATISVGANDAPVMETLKVELMGGLAVGMRGVGSNTQVGNPGHATYKAHAENPAIAWNGTGECLLVWQDARVGTPDYDIYAQRMDVNGSPVGASIAVGTMTGVQNVPVVAYGATGYMVAWQDARNGGSDIYAQRVNADGTLAGANFIVSNATNNQTAPAITWSASASEFMVTWADGRTPATNTNTDIYAQRVSPDGTMNGANFAVCTATLAQGAPAVAFDGGTGQYVFTWQDGRNATNLSDIWARRMATGGAFTAEFPVCTATGNQLLPKIAYSQADNGNECLIVWQDARISGTNLEVYGARLAANDTFPAGEVLIASGTKDQAKPHVVWNGTGYMVSWQDHRASTGPDIYVRPVTAAGSPGSEAIVTNHAETQFNPTLAWNGTRHLVAWHDNRTRVSSDIFTDTVNAGGTPAGALINVGDVPENAKSDRPAIAHNTVANNYLVVWQDARNDSNDIYGQIMSASGTPAGGDFPICQASGGQTTPAVTYNAGANEYMVVWPDSRNGSYVNSARVGPTGNVISEQAVSTGAGTKLSPRVAFNPTSQEYLVVWHDNRVAGSQDVYASRVSALGVAGGDFPIATGTGNQQIADVAYNGHADANTFLVTWEDSRVGGYVVYCRRMAADGTLAAEYKISPTGNQTSASVTANATTKEFLVAYASGVSIQARRTGVANDVLGASATVVSSNSTGARTNPRAVWNPTAEEYVVVWDDARNSHYDVYGRRLLADATGIATDFHIGQFLGNQQHPAIAFNVTNNQLLVTWSDYRNFYGDLYTQLLDSFVSN